ARRFDAPPLLDVRSDARDVEAVDVTHLAADLVHGARHSREHEIAPEETLIADAADRLHLAGDLAVFLDLDELVEALLPGPTVEHASRELVDDLHLAFVDEIMLIALEEMQRAQRLDDELVPITRVAPQTHAVLGPRLETLLAGRGQRQAALALVELIVHAELERAGGLERRHEHVFLEQRLAAPRDDERRHSLVDQHAVGFVHEGEEEAAQQQAASVVEEMQAHLAALAAQPNAVAQMVEG